MQENESKLKHNKTELVIHHLRLTR